MDLTQLEMLVATVDTGGVQKAAARVFRTQPAVSMALRKLEQEIGAPLFDRSTRGAYVMTPQGELLYACAKKLLRLRDETLAEIRALREFQSGRVRIGANESTGSYLLPKLIQSFHALYPKIHVELRRQNSAALINDLKEDLVDIAFVSFSPEDPDIEATPIMTDPLILIVGPQHPLRERRIVQMRELGNERFLAHSVPTPSRTKVIEAFRHFQTPLHIVMEISTIETIKRLVAMGLGIGFVPLMCVQEELKRHEVVHVPVDGFSYERTLWMLRRRGRTHTFAAQEFASQVGNRNQNRN
jgi:DNA-binding transcriptional LysR family regulator